MRSSAVPRRVVRKSRNAHTHTHTGLFRSVIVVVVVYRFSMAARRSNRCCRDNGTSVLYYTVAPPLLRAGRYGFGGLQGFSDATGSEEEPDDLEGRTSELRRTFTRRRRHIPLAPSAFWLPAPSPSFGRRRRTGQRAVGRPRLVVLRSARMVISVFI